MFSFPQLRWWGTPCKDRHLQKKYRGLKKLDKMILRHVSHMKNAYTDFSRHTNIICTKYQRHFKDTGNTGNKLHLQIYLMFSPHPSNTTQLPCSWGAGWGIYVSGSYSKTYPLAVMLTMHVLSITVLLHCFTFCSSICI